MKKFSYEVSTLNGISVLRVGEKAGVVKVWYNNDKKALEQANKFTKFWNRKVEEANKKE